MASGPRLGKFWPSAHHLVASELTIADQSAHHHCVYVMQKSSGLLEVELSIVLVVSFVSVVYVAWYIASANDRMTVATQPAGLCLPEMAHTGSRKHPIDVNS